MFHRNSVTWFNQGGSHFLTELFTESHFLQIYLTPQEQLHSLFLFRKKRVVLEIISEGTNLSIYTIKVETIKNISHQD